MLRKLQIFFSIFIAFNIYIKSTKTFFHYFDIRLLGQKVNLLGLTIVEEKLRAIRELTNPNSLEVLKYYLG